MPVIASASSVSVSWDGASNKLTVDVTSSSSEATDIEIKAGNYDSNLNGYPVEVYVDGVLNTDVTGVITDDVDRIDVNGDAGEENIDLNSIDSYLWDLPRISGLPAVRLHGAGGNDQIWGSQFDDEIDGELGDDLISGDGGDDELFNAGQGTDDVRGGSGTDTADDDANDTFTSIEVKV